MIKKITLVAVVLLALLALAYYLMTGVGKPISTNLSIVGQGKPVLALAYENFSPTSGEALNQLRQIQGDYDSQISFVVADLGSPQGLQLANQFKLSVGMAVFLNQDGQALQVVRIPADERELRSLVDSNLEAMD